MSDFLAALGLFFAIEGIFLAAFPVSAKPVAYRRHRFGAGRRADRLPGARLNGTFAGRFSAPIGFLMAGPAGLWPCAGGTSGALFR
jgi:hypothetical protein